MAEEQLTTISVAEEQLTTISVAEEQPATISMAKEQNQTNSSSAVFSHGRRHKVRPFSAGTAESELVEIRPKRIVRIQHFNARPRDSKFEKEMQMQMLYKSQGMSPSGGPLSMPKKKPVREASTLHHTESSSALPNVVSHNSTSQSKASASGSREISASGSKAHFTSPSNVHVAMASTENKIASDLVNNPQNEITEEKDHIRLDMGKHIPMTNNSALNSSLTDASDKNLTDDNKATVTASHQTISRTASKVSDGDIASSAPKPQNLQSPRTPSTVLFFLHGVGGSSDVWQAQFKHFAREGYEIVAPDLIGHGMSCTPREAKAYHFLEIAADMEEIFDKYCKKRNIVIGHSYGSSFAVVLARRRSRRVQKLVLVSGGSPTPLAPQPGIFSLPRCMLRCFRPCLNLGFERSAFHKTRRPVVDKEEAFSIPTYVLKNTMNGQVWPDGDELYHQWLLCSTLLIYGAQDKLVTLKEEEHMEEVIFRSRLEVIRDASHMVMIEAPDEVNRLLQDFFMEDSTLATKSNSPQPPAPLPPAPPPLDRSASRVSIKSTKSHKAMPSHFK